MLPFCTKRRTLSAARAGRLPVTTAPAVSAPNVRRFIPLLLMCAPLTLLSPWRRADPAGYHNQGARPRRWARGDEAPRARRRYFVFVTFQNTGTGATSMPSTFLRNAIGWYHWPRLMWVGWSTQYFCRSMAICFCFAGSLSLANWSRIFSIVASHGQPNIALSHEALKKPAATGLRMSAATHEVSMACQPP